MSGLVLVGEMSLAALCPLCITSLAAATASLNASVTGLLAVQVGLTLTPPSITGSITAAAQILANLELALSLGITFPSASLQISAVAALLVSLDVELQLLLELQGLLATAGVFVYKFDGSAASLGPAISAALGGGWPDGTGPGAQAHAILLGTVTNSTWEAMRLFFAGVG